VTALARYVAASCLGAQRWVGPGLAFVVGLAITFAGGGEALSTLAEGAIWLFPITAWLTVTTLNDEDPSRADITAAAAGGMTRVRAGKLAVAAAVAVVLTFISLLAAYLASRSTFTLHDLPAGLVAHLMAVAGGVAVGSVCARPVLTRTGWAVLVVIGLTVIDLVIPGAPPARAILDALDGSQAHLWRSLALGAGEVVVLAVVLIGFSVRVSWARS
jgi:hypothetical protein